ncbi:cation:proton antiporter [Clostridium sardiniense]|uniref:cation:proton antiporter n=1 Tax=Clostridium sardiniense TaxID=29369 RepID=UPI003D34EB31
MEETLNYDSLLILTVVAFFTPFLVAKLKKIKIPYQVGEIFIGIILGKSFLNIIKPDVWILFLSNLGLAYLMFLSGLEINFDDLKLKDNESIIDSKIFLSVKMFIISLIVSIILSFSLKFVGIDNGTLFFALLFTAAAPALLVPILKAKHILNSDFGQSLLIFGLIGELVSLIGITFVSSVTTYGLSLKSFTFLIIFGAAFIMYFLAKILFKINDFSAVAFKNLHLSIRGAFALVLVLVAVAEKVGSEIILGSFLAGIIFSLLVGKAKEEISHQLDVIGYGFLIPIFFIMIGVNIDLNSIIENPGSIAKIPVFLIIFFLVKFIPCLLLKKKYGMRNSLASSMILTAQLSLVIVGAQMALNLGYINNSDYSAFVVTTVISCILFPILFEKLIVENENTVQRVAKDEKIIIREFLISNQRYLGKSLKECKLPVGCRIFSIIRDDEEIMPTADTVLEANDLIILAGVRHAVEDTINMLTVCNLSLPN